MFNDFHRRVARTRRRAYRTEWISTRPRTRRSLPDREDTLAGFHRQMERRRAIS